MRQSTGHFSAGNLNCLASKRYGLPLPLPLALWYLCEDSSVCLCKYSVCLCKYFLSFMAFVRSPHSFFEEMPADSRKIGTSLEPGVKDPIENEVLCMLRSALAPGVVSNIERSHVPKRYPCSRASGRKSVNSTVAPGWIEKFFSTKAERPVIAFTMKLRSRAALFLNLNVTPGVPWCILTALQSV